jgi:outer membrane lipoprotein-sorting protein
VQVFNGQETRSETAMTTICDGQYSYTIMDHQGQKSAVKSEANPMVSGEIEPVFDSLREHYTLEALPDEKVSGYDCYVVQATAVSAQNPMARHVYYFAKDLAVAIKTKTYDASGNVVMSLDTSDIKTNEEIDPERFVFKAPPGVEVQDMTGR